MITAGIIKVFAGNAKTILESTVVVNKHFFVWSASFL
jgi:hypothetical protein